MEEKIEVGDICCYSGIEFIVEGFTESGCIKPKSNNTFLKYVSSVNPEYCTLVKKCNIDKDKKIENLQAIISKNYKKIENQSKEITLLIQQKKKLKAILVIKNKETEKRILDYKYLGDMTTTSNGEYLRDIERLETQLNIANNTIALQIEENSKLNTIAANLQRSRSSCLEEIEKQKVIIEYLEGKINE